MCRRPPPSSAVLLAAPAGAGGVLLSPRRYFTDCDDYSYTDDDDDYNDFIVSTPTPTTTTTSTMSSVNNGEGSSRRSWWPPQRQHLYVMLDDWSRGFSVHKMDLDGNEADANDQLVAVAATDYLPARTYRRLPAPAVRFEYVHSRLKMMGSSAQFAALGSNIVAKGYPFSDKDGLAVVYDTKMAAQAFGRRLPEALERWDAAGNKLYAFTPSDRSVDCRPRIDAVMHRLEEDPSVTERWSRSHDPSPVPFDNDHAHRRITSHAVRPRGSAIFVSVENWSVPRPGHGDDHVAAQAAEAEAKKMAGTFSYDTKRGEWMHHGDWLLPFRGEAHYDGELDAWVGLHCDSRRHGKLCSYDIVAAGSHEEESNWKLCEVEVMTLTVEDDATLVPMGGGGKFCLVEGRS